MSAGPHNYPPVPTLADLAERAGAGRPPIVGTSCKCGHERHQHETRPVGAGFPPTHCNVKDCICLHFRPREATA